MIETVGELKEALKNLKDDVEILIYVQISTDEEDNFNCRILKINEVENLNTIFITAQET